MNGAAAVAMNANADASGSVTQGHQVIQNALPRPTPLPNRTHPIRSIRGIVSTLGNFTGAQNPSSSISRRFGI